MELCRLSIFWSSSFALKPSCSESLQAMLGYLGYEMSAEAPMVCQKTECPDMGRGGEGGRDSKKMSCEEVVAKMLEEVDIDGSGTLSFSEFLIFMRTHPYSSRLTDVFPQHPVHAEEDPRGGA